MALRPAVAGSVTTLGRASVTATTFVRTPCAELEELTWRRRGGLASVARLTILQFPQAFGVEGKAPFESVQYLDSSLQRVSQNA